MDPLIKVKQSHQKAIISDRVFSLISKRFPIVVAGINRIEKACGIDYPIAYVEPSVLVSAPDPTSYQYGILFARTIPLLVDEKFQVVIQISAPLVAYGLKGTIHAILAHEFLHYLELIRRVSKMEILSDEISGNLFENIYADDSRLFDAKAVFNDKTLLHHITKKFPSGFRDYKLEDKTVKFWIEKDLPKININLDSNIMKISADQLSKIRIKSDLLQKIQKMEQRSSKLKKKRPY